jgi:hypothetical protein
LSCSSRFRLHCSWHVYHRCAEPTTLRSGPGAGEGRSLPGLNRFMAARPKWLVHAPPPRAGTQAGGHDAGDVRTTVCVDGAVRCLVRPADQMSGGSTMRRIALVGLVAFVGACKQPAPPGLLQEYQSRSLMTCCNIHYEGDEINDANYFVGTTIPAGTPVQVLAMTGNSVTFMAAGKKLTLVQSYGRDQESFQQYLSKVLVPDDPKAKLATFPRSAQQAIHDGRVEKGMTREEVIIPADAPHGVDDLERVDLLVQPLGHIQGAVRRPGPRRDRHWPSGTDAGSTDSAGCDTGAKEAGAREETQVAPGRRAC